jgi:hypothetical protein
VSFHVLRTYSHTDKRCLWKVESRPFVRREDADFWKEFVEKEYKTEHPKGKHIFFVVERL